MAWNEPGNSGDKDPWGSGGGNQGPPDLDEVVKGLQEKMSRLFGGGRRSGGGNGSNQGGPTFSAKGLGASGLGLVLFIAALVWAISGIYIVDEGKRGVVLQFGAYHDTTMPGPHWYPRFIQNVTKVDADTIRSIELGYRADEALMLTQDENIIDIKFAVQYQINNPRDYLYNVRDPDATLRQAMESVVREIIGKNKMDFVITGGRTEVVDRAQVILQEILDLYQAGLFVTELTMQDAQPPQQVQGAFADAVKAREDKERIENEAETYSNDVIPKARGKAARMLEEASAYRSQVVAEAEGETNRFLKVLAEYQKAPGITRQRLYIDSLESVLTNSSKVMIDSKGSNNLLYLPLDKIIQQGVSSSAYQSGQSMPNPIRSSSEDKEQSESRSRENLRRRELR